MVLRKGNYQPLPKVDNFHTWDTVRNCDQSRMEGPGGSLSNDRFSAAATKHRHISHFKAELNGFHHFKKHDRLMTIRYHVKAIARNREIVGERMSEREMSGCVSRRCFTDCSSSCVHGTRLK